MHAVPPGGRLAALIVLAAIGLCWPSLASARSVQYAGRTIDVPRGWAVYDLSARPTTCVRFDRHALYLGSPTSRQRCPAYAIGRTESILVRPSGHVTATWNRHPETIKRALHTSSLPPAPDALAAKPVARDAVAAKPVARDAAAAKPARSRHAIAAGSVYTGLGFDVCAAPSKSQMSAWSSTRYHAIGIYVGGVNSACSQPNLTASWVSTESAAGWRLIPTYVGLQGPGGCCRQIDPAKAKAQGAAAAKDAMARSEALGIGSGNPIYFDMEGGYARTSSAISAVLNFLSAWTKTLHANGFISGVYSSGAFAVTDLASKWGTSYPEPDDLWIADWNGRKTTADPYVPSSAWPSHQRLHQYSGGTNETHGGVTLDIDGDYLDGSTAGAAVVQPALAPRVKVRPGVDGSIQLNASWPGENGIAAWQILAGTSADALASLGAPESGGAAAALTVHSQFPYYAAEALDGRGRSLGTARAAAVRPHLAIFGRSAFVPSRGAGGLPVGCYTGSDCSLSARISAGRTLVGTARPQRVAGTGGGILHFKLTSAGRSLLRSAQGHLSVHVRVSDASGVKASAGIKLIAFSAHGRTPTRSATQARTLRFMGLTDFVYRGAVGGILASCPGSTPCDVTTAIQFGSTTIATAGPQFLGANELGYLRFKATPAGRRKLAHARGNKLGVTVTLTDENSSASATGSLVLIGYR